MDEQKTERMLARAAARAAARGYKPSKRERPAPMPKPARDRSSFNGRHADALLERAQAQRQRRTWDDQG